MSAETPPPDEPDDLDDYEPVAADAEERAHEARKATGGQRGTTGPVSTNGTGQAAEVDDLFLDWTAFWATERPDEDWLVEPFLARGRGHALWAARKLGKSLFTLGTCAPLVTTPPADDEAPVAIAYLDYEMSEADLKDRLEDMGYGPDTDWSRFHYALLPSLPPLDTGAGAQALAIHLDKVEAQHPGCHLLVIIDTTSRAVEGDENESKTIISFFRHTGTMLKRRGCTWARLDHAGKDTSKGQRGSSAKGDDVDIVWRLEKVDGGFQLDHQGVSRIRWAPQKVTYQMRENPLRFDLVPLAWPAGTEATARLLDLADVPIDASGNRAQAALTEAGEGRRRGVVVAAQKFRQKANSREAA